MDVFVKLTADGKDVIVNLMNIVRIDLHHDGTSTVFHTDGLKLQSVDAESTQALRMHTVDQSIRLR